MQPYYDATRKRERVEDPKPLLPPDVDPTNPYAPDDPTRKHPFEPPQPIVSMPMTSTDGA